jgi:hypothetical protein
VRPGWLAAALGLAQVLTAEAAPPRPPAPKSKPLPVQAKADPGRDAQLFKEFGARVGQYVELHKKLRKEVPPISDEASPYAIKAHKEALAKAIRGARAGARPGDLIGVELQPVLRRLLRSELAGPGSAPAREAVLEEGNPRAEKTATPVVVAVNAVYPTDAPFSTVPPNVLLKLPTLPDDYLEYRFVGKDLVVRDAVADVIVDFMKEGVP